MTSIKIFMTGATGFIGQHVVRELSIRGCEISCLVRKDTRSRKPGVFSYLSNYNVRIVYGDILRKSQLEVALKTDDFDAIIHLAAVISGKNVNLMRDVNVTGTKNLYETVRSSKTNPIKIVHFSTAAVVGPAPSVKIVDEDVQCDPETPYEITKLESEEIAKEYGRSYGLPMVVIRPVHVYGPLKVDDLIFRMLKMVKRGVIVKPPKMPLDLLNVKNLAYAVGLLIDSKNTTGRTYIIKDAVTYTTDELIDTMVGTIKRKPLMLRIPKLVFKIYSKYSKQFRYGLNDVQFSDERIINDTGYTPYINLKQGIKEYIRWLIKANLLDSSLILDPLTATFFSIRSGKGLGCAYDYVIRIKTAQDVFKRTMSYPSDSSMLLVIPSFKHCPPVEFYEADRILDLNMDVLRIPETNPLPATIKKSLSKLDREGKYNLAVFVGEDLTINSLRELVSGLKRLAKTIVIYAHNGNNSYHMGSEWQGITFNEATQIRPASVDFIDVPFIPANISLFSRKTSDRVNGSSTLSKALILPGFFLARVVSSFERHIPFNIRAKLAHMIFILVNGTNS